MGVRLLYKLRSNTTYTKFLNTLENRKDQKYEENKAVTKPTEIHMRKLEQGYFKEQKDVEENHLTQQPFCYYKESPTNNENEGKNFLQHKEEHKNTKEYGKKVGFLAVFSNITRRGALMPVIGLKTVRTDSLI